MIDNKFFFRNTQMSELSFEANLEKAVVEGLITCDEVIKIYSVLSELETNINEQIKYMNETTVSCAFCTKEFVLVDGCTCNKCSVNFCITCAQERDGQCECV